MPPAMPSRFPSSHFTAMTAQQLDPTGRLRHLLTLEGMPRPVLESLLDRAQACHDSAIGRDQARRGVLAGTSVCTLFFERSTRTRSSFTLAAQRLGADVMAFDASTSSTKKGETDTDTLRNLEAMGVRGFVIRHPEDGAVARLAGQVQPGTCLLNAGGGRHRGGHRGHRRDRLLLLPGPGHPDPAALKALR